MALKLITEATALAITVAEAKAQAHVDTSDADARITAYILAATKLAEQATGRAIMPQTWELTLDAFPSAFELTRVPVSAVTSIQYVDFAGGVQLLSETLYALDNADDYGHAYVVPVYAGCWPNTRDQVNAVALRYTAGYANAAAVPESIKLWIAAMVTTMIDNPASVDSKQSYELGYVDRLLDAYKVW